MSDVKKTVLDHVGKRDDKHYKATLFQADQLLLGVNCLESGQAQAPHIHQDQTKFYYVLEGEGWFTVGDETFAAGVGEVVWAAPAVRHGVENRGTSRLSLLVGIAPSP